MAAALAVRKACAPTAPTAPTAAGQRPGQGAADWLPALGADQVDGGDPGQHVWPDAGLQGGLEEHRLDPWPARAP